jgi:hypothetical protein
MNHDKLSKLLALASSDNDAEALAALRKAKSALAAEGLDFKDVAARMKGGPSKVDTPRQNTTQSSGGFSFDGFGDWMEQREPGWKAKQAEANANRAMERAAKRREILERYGSEEAAMARDPREQALHNAALPWLEGPFQPNGDEPHLVGRWHRRMGGWELYQFRAEPADPCRAALLAAIPLPTTIREAREEAQYWEIRDDELCHVFEDWNDTSLDLPAAWRRNKVRDMWTKELPIVTLDDILVRLEYAAEEIGMRTVCDAVPSILDAFRTLVMQREAPVQSGHPLTATERRARIVAMLSNPDTFGWSDRAIARAVGVSPTTVGGIRKQVIS